MLLVLCHFITFSPLEMKHGVHFIIHVVSPTEASQRTLTAFKTLGQQGQMPRPFSQLCLLCHTFKRHKKELWINHGDIICVFRHGNLQLLRLSSTERQTVCRARKLSLPKLASCVIENGRGRISTRKLCFGSGCRRSSLNRTNIFHLWPTLQLRLHLETLTLTPGTLKCSHRGQCDSKRGSELY